MKELDLQTYLYEHIPLSSFMQVEVLKGTPDTVELAAPFGPNINHKGTVFGGSVSTLAILSAWSLLHLRLKERNCQIVIQNNQISYLKPIHGSFKAVCHFEEGANWPRFLRSLTKTGKARVKLKATVYSGTTVSAEFEGHYVAFASRGP